VKRIIITVDTDNEGRDEALARELAELINSSYTDYVYAHVDHDLPTYTGRNQNGDVEYLVTVLPDGKTAHVATRTVSVARWSAPTFCRRTDDTRPST